MCERLATRCSEQGSGGGGGLQKRNKRQRKKMDVYRRKMVGLPSMVSQQKMAGFEMKVIEPASLWIQIS